MFLIKIDMQFYSCHLISVYLTGVMFCLLSYKIQLMESSYSSLDLLLFTLIVLF